MLDLSTWQKASGYLDNRPLPTELLTNILRHGSALDKDAFSKGQLISKIWICEELFKHIPSNQKIVVCGGWYGILSILLDSKESNQYVSIDLDPDCKEAIAKLTSSVNITSKTKDMYKFDYSDYDVIINTSCEHIPNFDEWFDNLPEGVVVVLQSNNFYEGRDHINCISELRELLANNTYSQTLYSNEMKLPDYTRYMKIVIK